MNRAVELLLLCLATVSAPIVADEPDTVSWEGVWGAERRFGPRVAGPVTLQRQGKRWFARFQGEVVEAVRHVATTDGDESVDWSFRIPAEGTYRGRQDGPGQPIAGHWYQAPGEVEAYLFANPLRLEPAGAHAFAGSIVPFPQEVSLYFSILRADDGGYRAFLRNPQRNLGTRFRVDRVRDDEGRLLFLDRDGETLAAANVVEPGERFTLRFPRYDATFDFTRRDRADAPGFYPRRTAEAPRQILRPPVTGDGWSTASLEPKGVVERHLVELVSSIATGVPDSVRSPYVHSLLIAHRGALVLEEYFHGHDRDTPHDSRSSGKSLASALVGIAVHEKALSGDALVYPMFGGVERFENPDPRKNAMTVRHLLTMSSGYDCDDNEWETPGNEDRMQEQEEEPDWHRYTLNLPMVRDPGEQGVYCSAGINLLGAAIREATGEPLPEFFRTRFAEPLGIGAYHMNLGPNERGYLGGGIRLRPRDFLKLGQVFLDGGVWNGRRILGADWVRESTRPHASVNDADDYGYAWWLRSYEVEGRVIRTFQAGGNGGQLLIVAPELELAVMINAGNYGDYRTWTGFRDRFMTESILPAFLYQR